MALDARVLLGPHGSEKHGGVNDYVDVAFHLPRWARVSIHGPPDHPVYALRYERCLAKPLDSGFYCRIDDNSVVSLAFETYLGLRAL